VQQTAQATADNLRNLDVLRAYAVLVVAGSHLCRFCGFAPRYAAFIANLGVGGVLMFFVHTSLVLLLSMQRMKPNKLTRSFYIRRAFRIYPLCWVAIALVLTTRLTDVDLREIARMGWQGVLANGLLLQNVFRYPKVEMPLWSLPWEVQMYLFLPVFHYVLAKHRHKLLPLIMWVGATALAIICTSHSMPRALHASIFPPLFIGGMVAFRLLHSAPVKLPSFLWWFGLPALMVVRCSLLHEVLIDTTRNAAVNATTCLVLGLAVPLFAEVREDWLSRLAHVIAKYSYGIYLLHVPCLALVFFHFQPLPAPLKIGVFIALTGAASALTYHLIERPLIRVGQSIAGRMELNSAAQ